MDSDSADPPEIRAHCELLAAHALGHPTSTCIQHLVNHPFGPLAMETMRCAQGSGRRASSWSKTRRPAQPAHTRRRAAMVVATTRGVPIVPAEESTVTRDDADRLRLCNADGGRDRSVRIGAFRTMNRGRVGAGRTSLPGGRVCAPPWRRRGPRKRRSVC